ncbi:hypothetical protein Q8A73_012825 [Channa argus]|nr:hypothetical protein Q8A73_012825 [Channa argus]
MSINSSTFSNDSSLPSELYCLIFKPSSSVFSTFTITNIFLLLPLSILVLYRGLQRWHHQHLSATAAATSTHSNSFTYHLVSMELINVFGSILCCYGIYENDIQMLMMWFYFFSITWYGETYFHILTCVEHYLAVVHPITYLTLRKERGIRLFCSLGSKLSRPSGAGQRQSEGQPIKAEGILHDSGYTGGAVAKQSGVTSVVPTENGNLTSQNNTK